MKSVDEKIGLDLKDRFDKRWFLNYQGASYDETIWKCTAEPWFVQDVFETVQPPGWKPRTLLDLGAANGLVQEAHRAAFHLEAAHGIEVSEYCWRNRVSNDVFLGDVFEVLEKMQKGQPIPGFPLLDQYDVVILNMVMYLSEAQLDRLLDLIPQVLKPDSLLFAMHTFDVSAHMVSTYLRNGYGSLEEHDQAPLLCRPKWWWLEKFIQRKYTPVFDEDGVIVFKSGPYPHTFGGRAWMVDHFWPGPGYDSIAGKGCRAPVYLRHRGTERTHLFVWTNEEDTECWKEVDGEGECSPAKENDAIEQVDLCALARTGCLGSTTNMWFRPAPNYSYAPTIFTLYFPDTELWQNCSDSFIQCSAPLRQSARLALIEDDMPSI
jgi:hypothetical protein